jgi:hypothetical protein
MTSHCAHRYACPIHIHLHKQTQRRSGAYCHCVLSVWALVAHTFLACDTIRPTAVLNGCVGSA